MPQTTDRSPPTPSTESPSSSAPLLDAEMPPTARAFATSSRRARTAGPLRCAGIPVRPPERRRACPGPVADSVIDHRGSDHRRVLHGAWPTVHESILPAAVGCLRPVSYTHLRAHE